MKKTIAITAVIFLTLFVAATAFAAGGKVRGAKGQGPVEQIQIRNTDQGNFVF